MTDIDLDVDVDADVDAAVDAGPDVTVDGEREGPSDVDAQVDAETAPEVAAAPVGEPVVAAGPAPSPTGAAAPEAADAPALAAEPAAPGAASAPAGPSGRAAATIIVGTLSGLALWIVLFALVLSPLQEKGRQRQLQAALREQLALATVPIGGVIEPGAPIASISIPSIDLHDVVIVEGTGSAQTETGPGHRRDTPLPGQPGTPQVMGRSELFGAPFARVPSLLQGDVIRVETGQGVFEYKVDRVRRDGDPLPGAPGTGNSRLVLVTSAPAPDSSALQTVYVDSTLQGDAYEPPEPRPLTISSSELPMAGQEGALVLLIFWLQALVAAVVVVVYGLTRWSRPQTLIVGIPVIAAVLWGATSTAFLLVPNLV